MEQTNRSCGNSPQDMRLSSSKHDNGRKKTETYFKHKTEIFRLQKTQTTPKNRRIHLSLQSQLTVKSLPFL